MIQLTPQVYDAVLAAEFGCAVPQTDTWDFTLYSVQFSDFTQDTRKPIPDGLKLPLHL